MKSVLISIQPQWAEKIAKGEKTIEVRKTAPKCEVPFKAYIYCTKPKKWFRFSSWGYASDECLWFSNGKIKMCDGFEFWADGKDYQCVNGKVIGEFICDKITDISVVVKNCNEDYNHVYHNDECKGSCLTWKELQEYGKDKPLYGWHISDLKIYDKPRELNEFSRPCSYSGLCFSCKRTSFKKDGNLLCNTKINRAPQSWCYVEELQEKEK